MDDLKYYSQYDYCDFDDLDTFGTECFHCGKGEDYDLKLLNGELVCSECLKDIQDTSNYKGE